MAEVIELASVRAMLALAAALDRHSEVLLQVDPVERHKRSRRAREALVRELSAYTAAPPKWQAS